ncbi:hypothetical protein BGY98DRAFT_687988 [Russula aff. rugulosa BPL654]|nr:hypothetical protein BGY98DRAFT_687988 [Russula aff. rugulosa BPL654]
MHWCTSTPLNRNDPYVSASETQPSFAASGLRSPSQTSNNIRRAFSVRVTESTDNSNIDSPLPPSQILAFQRCARHDSSWVFYPRRLRCSRAF